MTVPLITVRTLGTKPKNLKKGQVELEICRIIAIQMTALL